MRRFTSIGKIGLLFTALLSLLSARMAFADHPPPYEPMQVVVRLASPQSSDLTIINQVYGTTTLMSLYNREDIFLLQAPAGTSAEALVQLMENDPLLEYAELNYLTEDPESGSTNRIYGWGTYSNYHGQGVTTAMQLEDAHAQSSGAGAVIAILDSGVQMNHPELAGSLSVLGFDFVDSDPIPEDTANGLDDDGDGLVDEGYGHGTHVAGIVHMVAPGATLLPLRVLNSDGRGNEFKTATAILYAAYNGADVINLSLGTAAPSALLRDAVSEAAEMGVVVVAASGNMNSSVRQYPAAESCAIAVTSVNDEREKSRFSNYGTWVGVAAPGERIYSTFPTSGFASSSGTSMSTPFVAGQAALLRSEDPDLSLDDIGQLIGGTAQPLPEPEFRGLLGKGQIDILASLQHLAADTWSFPEQNLFADCTPD